ncbi:MAG: M43 family zinc metalloprotease [Bacteroidota bacterium]
MKRFYDKLLATAFVLILGAFSGQLQAQKHDCGTHDLFEHTQDPQMLRTYEQAETEYREYLKTPRRSSVVRTIPVVVHVVQSSNHNLVTMEDIQSQIDILNEDFRKITGTPGDGQGVDTEYEFCLASIDPNGCPTDGVVRVVDPQLAYHDRNVAQATMKGASQWDPYRYLNMWVPRVIDTQSSQGGEVIGYATFPNNLGIQTNLDGVVIHSGFFGRFSNQQYQGRTGTHEVGHWMGLFHTFQNGCQGASSTTCTVQGDRVCDTPQAIEPNYNCPSGVNSCTDTPFDNDDQIDNYMDYADGVCQSQFTAGQKDRMDFFMINFRGQLIAASNTAATGCDGSMSPGCTPRADFFAENEASCPGQLIQFRDNSFGPATSWNWSFAGGTPNTSSMQNPTISYANPGTYGVTLEVTNAFGNDTETKSGFITVAGPINPPIAEDFDASTSLPIDWTVLNPDLATTWEVAAGVDPNGGNAIKVNNYIADEFGAFNEGSNDDLITQAINLSNATEAFVTYERCYKRFNPTTLDTLRLAVSTDCGDNWTQVKEATGLDLVTVAGFSSAFEYVPNANSAWVTDTVRLDSFVGSGTVKLRFRVTSGAAQSVYLDNINLGFVAVSSAEAANSIWSLNVGPNPFTERLEVRYALAKPAEMEFSITDLTGRVLHSVALGRKAPGNHVARIPSATLSSLAPGVYFLRADSPLGTITRKLVKTN